MATPKKPAHLKQKTGPKPKAPEEKTVTSSFSLHPKKMARFEKLRGRMSRGAFIFSLLPTRKKNNK